jgi:hypothetical protein
VVDAGAGATVSAGIFTPSSGAGDSSQRGREQGVLGGWRCGGEGGQCLVLGVQSGERVHQMDERACARLTIVKGRDTHG